MEELEILTPEEQQEQDEKNRLADQKIRRQTRALQIMSALLICAICCILVFAFVFTPAFVSGTSMYPTLKDKQMVFLTRMHLEPKVNDIVVYHRPVPENYRVIKRVVGVAGDEFECLKGDTEGEYFLRKNSDENLTTYPLTISQFTFLIKNQGKKFKINEGCFFAIGDNYMNSYDCRSYGQVEVNRIVGIML